MRLTDRGRLTLATLITLAALPVMGLVGYLERI
jgi:hypothetical protein